MLYANILSLIVPFLRQGNFFEMVYEFYFTLFRCIVDLKKF